MPRNEDGEFELILGNKQLLSVFFIVVVLLGVFFTMGYIVGRNSAPVGATETASTRRGGVQDSKPIVLDSGAPTPVGQPAPPPSGAETTPQPGTQPVQTEPPPSQPAPTAEPPKPAPAKSEPVKTEPQPVKPDPVKTAETRPLPRPDQPSAPPPQPQPRSVEATPASPRVTEPSPGIYLQVSAVRRPEAEALAEILQKKGFPALLARSSKEGIFRVIVGPLKDATQVAKTRGDLEAAGMKNPVPQRY